MADIEAFKEALNVQRNPEPSVDVPDRVGLGSPPVANSLASPIEPNHYRMGQEVYPFIQSWRMSFAEGNVIKYVTRAPHKGKRLEDLKKARWYLDRLIEEAELAGAE